jgi:hypothetical protein
VVDIGSGAALASSASSASSSSGTAPQGSERDARGGTAVTEQLAPGFAGLLWQLRIEVRLSQEELAAAAGLSPRTVKVTDGQPRGQPRLRQLPRDAGHHHLGPPDV